MSEEAPFEMTECARKYLKGIVEDSMKTGKEIAATVCVVGDEFTVGDSEKMLGEENYVSAPKCLAGSRIGTVHTHPRIGAAHMSNRDIHALISSGDEFACSLAPMPDGGIVLTCAEKCGCGKDGRGIKISRMET